MWGSGFDYLVLLGLAGFETPVGLLVMYWSQELHC
jgi:hypothetical protein